MMNQLKPRSSFSGGGVLTSQRRSQTVYDLRVSAWCGIASARCESIIPHFISIFAGQYLNSISFAERCSFITISFQSDSLITCRKYYLGAGWLLVRQSHVAPFEFHAEN